MWTLNFLLFLRFVSIFGRMIEPNLIQTKYSEVISPSNFWRPGVLKPVALSELRFLLTSEQLGAIG